MPDKKTISTQQEWEEIRGKFTRASDYRKFGRDYTFNPTSRVRVPDGGGSIRGAAPQAPSESNTGRFQIFREAMREGRSVEEVNAHAKEISKHATRDADIFIALFNEYVTLQPDFESEAALVADDLSARVGGPSLDRLDWLLAVAAKLADRAAKEVRDVDLNREVNIRRVGEALGKLFAIRSEIYEKRPDLLPEFVKVK